MRKLALVSFFVTYFLYFSWDGLQARFSPDDLMNIYAYWHPRPVQFLLSQFTLWRGVYRPMGGMFYLPILRLFGLDPLPYHIGLLLVLMATVFLVYWFARLLGCSELVSALSALIVSYHSGLSNLYYNTSFVYDALCGFFYLATLIWYARIRAAGRLLSGGETAAFLGLYLCALNSKEMAVTLPAILLAYEWMYQGKLRWRGPILAAALNLPYIYGKLFAAGALADSPGYQMIFSRQRLKDFQTRALGDLFLSSNYFDCRTVIVFWLIVTWLAWRRPRPVLRFCWFFIVVTPLPIEFLQGRSQACLYIPLFGWAVFGSVIFRDAVRILSAYGAREPVLRRLGRRGVSALLLATGVFLWAQDNRTREIAVARYSIPELGRQTQDVIQQLRTMNPRVRPGSRVVFLDDPFRDWDMAFIAELWFRDRSVMVQLHRKTPLAAEEIATADCLFTFEKGRLIRLR